MSSGIFSLEPVAQQKTPNQLWLVWAQLFPPSHTPAGLHPHPKTSHARFWGGKSAPASPAEPGNMRQGCRHPVSPLSKCSWPLSLVSAPVLPGLQQGTPFWNFPSSTARSSSRAPRTPACDCHHTSATRGMWGQGMNPTGCHHTPRPSPTA